MGEKFAFNFTKKLAIEMLEEKSPQSSRLHKLYKKVHGIDDRLFTHYYGISPYEVLAKIRCNKTPGTNVSVLEEIAARRAEVTPDIVTLITWDRSWIAKQEIVEYIQSAEIDSDIDFLERISTALKSKVQFQHSVPRHLHTLLSVLTLAFESGICTNEEQLIEWAYSLTVSKKSLAFSRLNNKNNLKKFIKHNKALILKQY